MVPPKAKSNIYWYYSLLLSGINLLYLLIRVSYELEKGTFFNSGTVCPS